MSEKLLEKLENLLNEEKWTRATINNYTIKNFEDLNQLIEDFKLNGLYTNIRETADEYLKHNKNSIVALYISSVIQLEDGNIDTNTYSLIKIFSDNLKWNIVEHLCKLFLDKISDKYLLRTLIQTYQNTNRKDELPELWEQLIRVDYEEADLVYKLAINKDESGNREEAINYYKKAINRYIQNGSYSQVEELWIKLLGFDEVGYEYFFNLEKKLSKKDTIEKKEKFSVERVIDLFELFYNSYKKKNEYDICIKILKTIIEKEPDSEFARKEIVEMYRKKYADHSCLEDYIKKSDIEFSWRNINDAIISFEKHISFDKNNFVFHRTWGMGRIKNIDSENFTIDFQNKQSHQMGLEMAISSLQAVSKNHIWVLKLKNLDLLKKKLKSDVAWGLKTLIMGFDNAATMKRIKGELVPDVMTESQWTSWWAQARKELKTNPIFGTRGDDSDVFIVRDKPLEFDEKIDGLFKNAKDFNQRFNITYEYIKENDPEPELVGIMIDYFSNFLKSLNNVNYQTIMSYILVNDIARNYPFVSIQQIYGFNDFYSQIEDPLVIYEDITLNEHKKEFIQLLKKADNNWQKVFTSIFYVNPNKFIYEDLYQQDIKKGGSVTDFVSYKIIKDLINIYKEYRESFVWVAANVIFSDDYKKLDPNLFDKDAIIFSMIHLIELTAKDIEIKKDVTKNKKVNKQIKEYLFKKSSLKQHVASSNREFSLRLFAIINELDYMEAEYIIMTKNLISEFFPDIEQEDNLQRFDSRIRSSILDKLLITEENYIKIQEELQDIQDVEIPENSKEIGYALEKGDLRENAEYKAAKERQTYLQNKLNKLISDLNKANIIRKSDVSGDFVSFGTKLTLKEKKGKKTVVYTILGPWESNTDQNIISYQSPLGMNLLERKQGEEVDFELNGKKYNYIVEKVEVADF